MLLNGTANATEFKLAKIRAKYDIATDKGRLDYIKEALALLAGHISPTEREVYAGRLAEETGISRGAIQTQLQGAVRGPAAAPAAAGGRGRGGQHQGAL